MKKILLFSLMVAFILKDICAQSQDVCECCTLSWMQSRHEFSDLFPPEIIVKNKLTSLLISRKTKNNIDSNAAPSAVKKEMEFNFYPNGMVKSIAFFQEGVPLFLSEYNLDGESKYKNKLLYLLDSTEKKITPVPQENWQYIYDHDLLIKLIKTDANGNIKDDSISDFVKFTFDSLQRIIEEKEQMYSFASTPIFNYTNIKYDNLNLSATAVTGTKDFLVTTAQLSFNTKWKLVYEKLLEHKDNKILREKFIQYNKQNQIERIELKSYQELTDCPDGGNYVDQFFRNDVGLIKQIVHTYAAYTCTLDFLYRK